MHALGGSVVGNACVGGRWGEGGRSSLDRADMRPPPPPVSHNIASSSSSTAQNVGNLLHMAGGF